MNVLYIDHYAGSVTMGMEFRPFYLAQKWKESGINTTVLAADYSHLRKSNPSVNKDMEKHEIDGVNFMFLKTPHYSGNGLGRIRSMFDFVLKGIYKAKKISDIVKPDIIICSSTYPLDTYIGQKIKRITGARLIHEIHDLWPLSPMELGGYSKNHPFIRVMQTAENSAYKNSDEIVTILPNTEPYIRSLGFDTPVIPIPNGLMEKDFINADDTSFVDEDIKRLITDLHEQGKYIIGYSGGISVSNSMDDFIDAMSILKSDKSIVSVIIGDGILKEELEEKKKKQNLDNIYFVGRINKNEIIGTLRLMDALYIGSKKSNLYEYGVSANKIFDYMLAGKPIVNAFHTEHSPMDYLGNTIKAEAENPKSIAEAILKAKSIPQSDLDKISEESIKYVKENHNYNILADRFSDLFYKAEDNK